jgi:ankyrin repeat protein
MGNGNVEIIELLIKAGADPSKANKHGEKPVHIARKRVKDPEAKKKVGALLKEDL